MRTDAPHIRPGQAVRFGCHAPMTGPMAMFGAIVVAARALFDEVNAAGGVHGHPIEMIVGDDAYDPARTPGVVERLFTEHDLLGLLLGVGTPPHATVVDRLAAANIPDLAVVTGAAALSEPVRENMFVANVPYRPNGRALGRHAAERARVGAITYATDFGRDWISGFTEGLGRPPACTRWLAADEAIEPAVAAMRRDGCEAVLVVARPEHEIAAIRGGARDGYRPLWLVGFVDGLASALDPADEVVGSHWLHMAEGTDTPAISDHRRRMARHAPELEVTGTTVGGQALAELTVELLRRAGPCPTRARLLAAVASLDGAWQSPLMRVAPCKQRRRPVIFDEVALLRLRAGAWVTA